MKNIEEAFQPLIRLNAQYDNAVCQSTKELRVKLESAKKLLQKQKVW